MKVDQHVFYLGHILRQRRLHPSTLYLIYEAKPYYDMNSIQWRRHDGNAAHHVCVARYQKGTQFALFLHTSW